MDELVQLRREFVMVTARIAVLQILPLVTIPILTKTLGAQGYGFWVQFSTALALLLPIVTLNLSFALVRHLPALLDDSHKRSAAYAVLLSVAVASSLAAALIYLNDHWIAEAFFDGQVAIVNLLALTIPLACLNLVFLDILRAERKILLHSLLQIAERTLIVILALGFIYLQRGTVIILSSWLIVESLLFVVLVLQIARSWGFSAPSFDHLREFLQFAVPMLLSAIGVSVVNFSDRYFIAYFLDVASVGVYNAGYVLGSSLMILVAPFTFLLPAVIAKHWDHQELEKVETIINYSFRYYIAFAIPMCVGVSILSYDLLRVLSTESIAAVASPITLFSAISSIFFGLYFFFTRELFLQKKSYPIAIQWLLAAAINAALNVVLIPPLSVYGAALSTLVSFLVIAALSLLLRPAKIPISVGGPFLLKCVGASAVMGLAVALLAKISQGTLWLLLVIIIGVLIYLALVLMTGAISIKEVQGLIRKELRESASGPAEENPVGSDSYERYSV